MSFMHEVVRIAHRFCDRSSSENIDRQERLRGCIVLVSIFYAILCIAFVRLQVLEKRTQRLIFEPDVAFELSMPPSRTETQPLAVPPPIGYIPGTISGGKPAAAKNDLKPQIPSVQTENQPQAVKPASAVFSRATAADVEAAIGNRQFPPLPEAYQGESIPFKIDLSKQTLE